MIFSDSIFFGFLPIAVAIYYLMSNPWWQDAVLVLLSAAFLSLFGAQDLLIAGVVAFLVWGGGLLQSGLGIKRRWPVAAALISVLVLIKATSLLPEHRNPVGAS